MIILVASKNGGTGKTTLVTNLAVMFNEKGKSVVIVDTDKKKSTSYHWVEKRKRINVEDPNQDQASPKLLDCVVEHGDFSKKLQELKDKNKYDVVIADCFSGVHAKFKSALLKADLVVIPCRGNNRLKVDSRTLSSIVAAVEEAKKANDTLVDRWVITMQRNHLFNLGIQSVVDSFKDKGIKLLQPFLIQNDKYKSALGSGRGVFELDDEQVKNNIRTLFSKINPEDENLQTEHDTNPIEPSKMDDGSSQEQEFEQNPDFREGFVSETDSSHTKFFNELEEFSQDQLAEKYRDVFLDHENKELKSKVIKGLILLRAKKFFKSNKKLGAWVNSIHSLCVDTQQSRTRYIHLAEFFKYRPINSVISVTVAYEIARPANKDVANEVYEQASSKKLSFAEVQKLIKQEKEKSNLKQKEVLPKDSKTIINERVKKVLKQVNGFNLGIDEQVKLLRQCISELKAKENDVIDSEPSDD